MKVTVILCTFNRSDRLRKALQSLALSEVSDSIQWGVLVVDNNSQDDTRKVAEEFCTRFPNKFQYWFEPRQGKSFALNAGIRETSGDVLAFLDDDVEVDARWLQNLTAPLICREWAGVGGRILPAKEFTPPHWLDPNENNALAPLALFDQGEEASELHEAPFGANMAFRREMFEKYGHFRTDLGPRPGSEIRNEDTEFGLRLLSAGERFWYEPSAVVYHEMPPNRICERYFLTWWFDKARADVRQSGVPQEAGWRIAGIPAYLFRRLLRWAVEWMFSVPASRRFSCKAKLWSVSGTIRECYRMSRLAS
jgi:glycosyltransferase involved in cell wall biosynthesis